MGIIDLFSSRQKELKRGKIDVFQYKEIPQKLRNQIALIVANAIGESIYNFDNIDIPGALYTTVYNILRNEYGQLILRQSAEHLESPKAVVLDFLLNEKENERVLDVIELLFQVIVKNPVDYITRSYRQVVLSPDEAVNDLNHRFLENGVGYQFSGNQIIKIDSLFTHKEVIQPTLNLLNNLKFAGANQEFLSAHEHYRNGRNKECLTDCLKAFESAMKTICQIKGWQFQPTDTASKLINICFQNNLIPNFSQNQFSGLQNLLVTGIPTIRNKNSGHGQGPIPQKVDDELTRYGLNLTGANIIFLIEQSGVK